MPTFAFIPDLLQSGIPGTVALAIVALLGYFVGRIRPRVESASDAQVRREIKRAHAVAKNLETIVTSLRKDVARHRANLDSFKTRLGRLNDNQDQEGWALLCEEAERMLGPTMELASQLARSYDQIRRQTNDLMTFTAVRTDPLTGICNRRAMDDSLSSMVAMKNRYDLGFSVAMFDIDHFKQINDQQGHLAGDAVIKAVAKLLDKTARDTDVVTRFGGEEFVVLLPNTDLHGACIFVERVRRNVESMLECTISGGVTSAFGNGETPESILQRADAALYAAKHAGRNCSFLHDGTNVLANEAVPQSDGTRGASPTAAESV